MVSQLGKVLRGITYSSLKLMRSTCGKSMCVHTTNQKKHCDYVIHEKVNGH